MSTASPLWALKCLMLSDASCVLWLCDVLMRARGIRACLCEPCCQLLAAAPCGPAGTWPKAWPAQYSAGQMFIQMRTKAWAQQCGGLPCICMSFSKMLRYAQYAMGLAAGHRGGLRKTRRGWLALVRGPPPSGLGDTARFHYSEWTVYVYCALTQR